jgi:hypothetical protein
MAYNYNLPLHLGIVTFMDKTYTLHTIHSYPDRRKIYKLRCQDTGEEVEMEFVPPESPELFADDGQDFREAVTQRIRDEKW